MVVVVGEDASGDELSADDAFEKDDGIVYPENGAIKACLNALLSPYLFRCMIEKSDIEVKYFLFLMLSLFLYF